MNNIYLIFLKFIYQSQKTFDVNEEFPEKDRNSRLKARKAEIRAKRRQKNIDNIDKLRNPKRKTIKTAMEVSQFKRKVRSDRNNIRMALRELSK